MTYPFVRASNDYGPRKGPVLGFVVHMAEGGGTVGFLAGPNVPRGVSVHYVIERTGRIVQMLLETHASGSINPQDIRTTDDAGGLYGATAAKAVMGSWWKDPNSAVISVEIEGFAAAGPNAAESASLRVLINDVRTRYPKIGLLGHRDFQDYKACPGKLIHWNELGGHGPYKAQPTYQLAFAGGAFWVYEVDGKPFTDSRGVHYGGRITGRYAKRFNGPTHAPCGAPLPYAWTNGTRVLVMVTAGGLRLKHVAIPQSTVHLETT